MLTQGEDVEAHALRQRGWSISAIARHLDRDRKTVRAYLNGDRRPGRRASSTPDPLARFEAYIKARFADDCHLWATALFDEWSGEIKQMKDDPSLRNSSQKLHDQTKQSYNEMIARMDSAAASMDPVLSRFKNRVLFIKHNLNAQAIASLKGTEVELGGDIDRLIKEMEASIAEADEFIAEIQPKKS